MVEDSGSSMDFSKIQDELDELNASVTKQGSLVRQLKKSNASDADGIASAVEELKQLKIAAEEKRVLIATTKEVFPRKTFDELILRKMFVVPSFEIHGGVKGLFDLGPPACSLKAAMIDVWRKHFVLQENMLEMECTCLTPEVVLKTSGHVERFTDLMVKDTESGECFRADKLLEDAIDDLIESTPDMSKDTREDHLRVQRQADAYTPVEIDALLLEYKCVGPASGKPYSPSFPFNLMFKTTIGPEGNSVGYLRPETAQGLFVNFRRLLDVNAGKMPFAAAQIGLGFRNEIAPRSGLLRVREFCMGEIEHFLPPNDKSHSNFASVADKNLVLFGRDDQLGSGKTKTMPIGHAVSTGLVNNQTLGYFMARTQLFLERIGMNPNKLRFRQHLTTEMAHYACDCWDLEIETSYGWVECVGHADRACYDLQVHGTATKTSMIATQKLDTPIDLEIAKLKFDRKALGKAFKKDQRIVSAALEAKAENWADFEPIANALATHGQVDVDGFTVEKHMLTYTRATKKVHEIKYTPSVIEPSFGMGRILYSLLEHSFYQRDGDEQRCVMKFPAALAPTKCAVLPLSNSEDLLNPIVHKIAASLMDMELATRVDCSSTTVGRRYARADEMGVPFTCTVDFQTAEDNTVTLRERDSTQQIRISKDDVTPLIYDMCHGRTTFQDAMLKYPIVGSDQDATQKSEPPTVVVETTSRGAFSRPSQSIL